ncbi:hypothetical protein I4F81_011972 [Pyropia yezoensis]|uniref:Uncharacterized protein n=1 Tax=Pyropia yezoensis TaxID=2788 RepID=A0ACC3CI92_PYRYE|nr:hypothetical protein I4F81_011972 [Neopyropia yezoensis]
MGAFAAAAAADAPLLPPPHWMATAVTVVVAVVPLLHMSVPVVTLAGDPSIEAIRLAFGATLLLSFWATRGAYLHASAGGLAPGVAAIFVGVGTLISTLGRSYLHGSSSLRDVCVAQWRLRLRSVRYRHGLGGGGGAAAADDGRGRPAAAAAAATAALAAAVGGDGPAGGGGGRRGAACRPVRLAWGDRPVWADAAADAAATAEVAAALVTAADLYAPRRLHVVLAMTPRAPVQFMTVVGDGWGSGGGEEGGGDGEGEAALVPWAYATVAAVLTRRLDVAVERTFEAVPAEEGGGGGLGL